MINKKLSVSLAALISIAFLSGFGLKDLAKKVGPDLDKCEKAADKNKCLKREAAKTAVTVAAITLAAKAITDVIVEYRTKKTASDKQVAAEYKKDNEKLPYRPQLVSYSSSLQPGQLVKTGKPISIVSQLDVVPGRKTNKVLIQEQIEIFDNEQTDLVIKSLVKDVNKKKKKAGGYENSFSFTLPEGMPQGVYRVKTSVLLNKEIVESATNDMQVVFFALPLTGEQFAFVQ